MRLAVAFLISFVITCKADRLDVPTIIKIDIEPNRTNYVATYEVTNNTPQPIQITGKATSCGCTSITLSKEQIGSQETAQITVTINSGQPSTNSVLLIDHRNHIYQTRFELAPK